MSLTIPLTPEGSDHFAFTAELDGVTYGFEFLWGYRDSKWYFSVNDAEGEPIVSHRKAVVSFPLLARFKREDLPPGALLLQDTAGGSEDPALDDLGTRVQLLYYTAAELLP